MGPAVNGQCETAAAQRSGIIGLDLDGFTKIVDGLGVLFTLGLEVSPIYEGPRITGIEPDRPRVVVESGLVSACDPVGESPAEIGLREARIDLDCAVIGLNRRVEFPVEAKGSSALHIDTRGIRRQQKCLVVVALSLLEVLHVAMQRRDADMRRALLVGAQIRGERTRAEDCPLIDVEAGNGRLAEVQVILPLDISAANNSQAGHGQRDIRVDPSSGRKVQFRAPLIAKSFLGNRPPKQRPRFIRLQPQRRIEVGTSPFKLIGRQIRERAIEKCPRLFRLDLTRLVKVRQSLVVSCESVMPKAPVHVTVGGIAT